MTHPGYADVPSWSEPGTPSPTPLPWLGFTVVVWYMAAHLTLSAFTTNKWPSELGPAWVAASMGIGVACCVAPLLIPRVTLRRRLVALSLFAVLYAVSYIPWPLAPDGLAQLAYWTTPVLYAAGWITVRHTSPRAYVALAVAPLLTTALFPWGFLRGGSGSLGGVDPFELFIALDRLSFVLPAIAAILVAAAIVQEVPAPTPGGPEPTRRPLWLAVVGLVAALVGAVLVAVPTGLSVLSIVLGHVAYVGLRRRRLAGQSLAITAFVLGYLEIAYFVWMIFQALANFRIE